MKVDDFHYLTIAAEREKAKRLTLRSSLAFTKYFFRKQSGRNFSAVDFHIRIGQALDDVIAGKIKKLIINLPPRYSKTEMAVKNFMAKGLAHNPRSKFIHLSYSDTLALDNSEDVKDMVLHPSYQELFPDVKLKRDSTAKKKWYTTKGGGVYATAAGGSVTGFGAGQFDSLESEDPDEVDDLLSMMDNLPDEEEEFSGALIIDDPIKPEDADSDIQRERVNNRYDSTIKNRVNSRNTPIIISMQRLHPKDLTGHLLESEPGEWTVISFPAITAKGEALWSQKHTLEELLKLKEANDVVFNRQYMQDPKPAKGLLFPENDLHYFEPKELKGESREYALLAVDPADTGGDDLAAPFTELYGNRVYVTDVLYNTDGTDINIPRLVDKIVDEKPEAVEIESNSAWLLFTKEVKRQVLDIWEDSPVRAISNHTNKQTRILARASFIRNHCYFLQEKYWTPEYRKFMKNLTSYLKEGTSRHDDAPDVMAIIAQHYMTKLKHLWS